MKLQYKKFHTPNEVKSWSYKNKVNFPSDSNCDDKLFLKAIELYTASANSIFNNHLRYNKTLDELDYLSPFITKMQTKLTKYFIPDNIIAYRYISLGLLKLMCSSYPPKKNMVIVDRGFMSTTLIRESVNAYRSGRKQNILLIISIPAGTKGTYVGLIQNTLPEYEVILAPNTKLRIDSKCFSNYWCTVV